MIISNNKRTKPKNIDNIEKIIEGGEIKFQSIYKNLKNKLKEELTSKLISRLFNLLEKQKNQIEEYKKEISALKNNLVYILKRILLSKNEDKNNLKNNSKMKNYNNIIKNYSVTTNNTTFTSFSPKYQSYSNLKLFHSFYDRNEIAKENNSTYKNDIPFQFNKPQTELDTKINNYINSIYKHNFSKNETNINNYYFLDKAENINDEISQKVRNKSKIRAHSTLNSNNNSKTNISSSRIKKRSCNEINHKKLSKSISNINNDNYEDMSVSQYNINDSQCLKVKKNISDKYFNNTLKLKENKSYKNVSNIIHGNKKNKKYNINLKKKMNKTNHYIPINRSPFIVNKV